MQSIKIHYHAQKKNTAKHTMNWEKGKASEYIDTISTHDS